jgi:hypothetical protein
MSLEAPTCNTVRQMIQRGGYGESVIAHLGECEQCLDVALNSVLADRQDISVSAAFAARVLARANVSPSTPAPAWAARTGLWPAIVVLCAAIGALSLPHLSVFAQSFWGTAVLAAASVEISLIVVWILGWNRSPLVFQR